MARRRRSNVWFDHSKAHAKAARRGWKHRKHRRHRDNPGGGLSIKRPLEALKAGFAPSMLKRAAWVVGGNLATKLVADQIISRVAILKQYDIANVATTLLVAGGAGYAANRFMPSRRDDVLLGGLLVGMARALKMVWPSQFGTLGLGYDDLDGLSEDDGMYGLGDYADPRQLMAPHTGTSGMEDYASFTPTGAAQQIAGMGDSMIMPQVKGAVRLDGFAADQAVAEEIAMQA
jgi:hypothetical protein